jgi:hypothetical protein
VRILFSKLNYANQNISYKITEIQRHGEAASCDRDAAAAEVKRIQQVLDEYKPEDRFNADETGCNWAAAPDRGLATKQMSGKKANKKRISVLFTCSEAGEKLPPLFIGKAKCPRPFKKKSGKALGLYYRNNKTAWMTKEIWEE